MKRAAAREVARELQLLASPQTDVVFHGKCMEPLLVDGDRLVVQAVSAGEIRLGDLVTYRHEDRFPTRRVVALRGERIMLWCDNWPRLRFRARTCDLLGRVEARIRDGETLAREDEAWLRRRDEALRAYRRERAGFVFRAVARRLRRLLPGA